MNEQAVIEHRENSAPVSWAVDPWVAMIERAARDPGVDPDKMIKLYELAEKSRLARARESFNRSMASAKGEIGPIFKNREVDFTSQKGRTHYRHEDLAEVARTVDPVLKLHGLSYRFRAAQAGKRLTVTCIVSHADGYSEETVLEADNDESGNKNAIQSVGSAATYLQRYTLKLALGLAATVDDDGRSPPSEPAREERSEIAQRYFDQAVARLESETDPQSIKTWWNSDGAKKERGDMLDRNTHAEILSMTKKRIAELENATGH